MNEIAELPKYICKKEVWALKIKSVNLTSKINQEISITPENKTYNDIEISEDYYKKHNPVKGGYYVVYKDGYKSFSPSDAFESGYDIIS